MSRAKSLLKKAEAFKNTHEGCNKEDQKIRLKYVERKIRRKKNNSNVIGEQLLWNNAKENMKGRIKEQEERG